MLPSNTASATASVPLETRETFVIVPSKQLRWLTSASCVPSASCGTPASLGSSSAHSGR